VSPTSTANKARRVAEAKDYLHDRARKFYNNGNQTNADKLERAALLYASAFLSHPLPYGDLDKV